MAQNILLKRSAIAGKTPDTGSLQLGELAINTYDGKIHFKKSGSVESIEGIVTTNSQVTGSIRITETGSFGSLRVNDTLTINHGEAIISGSALVTNDLTILGAVNARQFNISIISSSVLFESGSTKFGDTSDDTHSFTGSVSISGSLLVNGTEVGVAPGPNTFDFNLDPEAAGTVNFIEDSTANVQAIARTGSFDVLVNGNTHLSVSASAINVTTGSITANYMHLAKYISTAGDLDFNT
jgi:hypothetical protein